MNNKYTILNTINTNTPKELVESLKLLQHEGSLKSYIYRGQSNSEWELLPSIFREQYRFYLDSDSAKCEMSKELKGSKPLLKGL